MSRDSAEFAATSAVDVLIPESSSVNIEEALASSEAARYEDDSALITSVQQRSLLFFGTTSHNDNMVQCLTHLQVERR